MSTVNELAHWQSGQYTISKSAQHKDMFLITDRTDNKWWNITSTTDLMLAKYPPGVGTKKVMRRPVLHRMGDVHQYGKHLN